MRLEDMSFTDYLMAECDLRERQRKERMKQKEFEKYAKEHNIFYCTKELQEQCDVVSRQAVLDGIEELKQSPWATDKRGNGFEYLITEALDIVADLCVKQEPPVRPQEPKTGKWKFVCQHWSKCSECGFSHKFAEDWNYCPDCGVRMESEDKE